MKALRSSISLLAALATLSGCGTTVLTRERSATVRAEDRATLELLLQYCEVTVNGDLELGLSARSGLGIKVGGNCSPERAARLRELLRVIPPAPQPLPVLPPSS
jgi:hypothetical protein